MVSTNKRALRALGRSPDKMCNQSDKQRDMGMGWGVLGGISGAGDYDLNKLRSGPLPNMKSLGIVVPEKNILVIFLYKAM